MKLILLFLSMSVLSSCSEYYSNIQRLASEKRLHDLASGHELYFGDFAEIESVEKIDEWIWENFTYIEDYSWETLQVQTALERGYGDCDVFALIFMNIAKVRFNIEYDLIFIKITDREYHATVGRNGIIYNSYYYPMVDSSGLFLKCEFSQVFDRN